jgi:hypothetical protein
MEINVQHYLNRTADDQVQHFEQSSTIAATANAAGLTAALQPLATAINDATAAGELMRATLTINGGKEPVLVSFETGVINMPLANAKKVGGFLEADEIVPVNIYLVTESKYLNASGLRIDKLADSDEFAANTASILQSVVADVGAKLTHIAEEEAKPEPVAKPAPAKKTTAKKTTRRTTAKKSTTKKTTAKKTSAKKTTARKTTRKSTAKKVNADA